MKQEIIDQIRKSNIIKARICIAMNRSMQSVENWLNDNHPLLTTAKVLDVVSAELKLTRDQILEPVHA